jgi:hypothetical protein
VLVAREGDPIELGSWLAASSGAPLKLLGAAGQSDEGKTVTPMLAECRAARPAGHSGRTVRAEEERHAVPLVDGRRAKRLAGLLSPTVQRDGAFDGRTLI